MAVQQLMDNLMAADQRPTDNLMTDQQRPMDNLMTEAQSMDNLTKVTKLFYQVDKR